MPTLETDIVLFVFAELVGIVLVIIGSCWCCRSSLQRARNDEADEHALPMMHVGVDAPTQPKSSTRTNERSAAAAEVGMTHSQSHATDAAHGSSAQHSNNHGDRNDSSDNGDGLVSGGLWSFLTGVPEHRSTNRSTTTTTTATRTTPGSSESAARRGDVEVVNISVNTALDDSDDKLAHEARESGSAA